MSNHGRRMGRQRHPFRDLVRFLSAVLDALNQRVAAHSQWCLTQAHLPAGSRAKMVRCNMRLPCSAHLTAPDRRRSPRRPRRAGRNGPAGPYWVDELWGLPRRAPGVLWILALLVLAYGLAGFVLTFVPGLRVTPDWIAPGAAGGVLLAFVMALCEAAVRKRVRKAFRLVPRRMVLLCLLLFVNAVVWGFWWIATWRLRTPKTDGQSFYLVSRGARSVISEGEYWRLLRWCARMASANTMFFASLPAVFFRYMCPAFRREAEPSERRNAGGSTSGDGVDHGAG